MSEKLFTVKDLKKELETTCDYAVIVCEMVSFFNHGVMDKYITPNNVGADAKRQLIGCNPEDTSPKPVFNAFVMNWLINNDNEIYKNISWG